MSDYDSETPMEREMRRYNEYMENKRKRDQRHDQIVYSRGINVAREQLGFRVAPTVHNPRPMAFVANGESFWDVELSAQLLKHNARLFQREDGDYEVRGEGIRLRLPFRWLLETPSEELTARLLAGVEVSRSHASQLGY